MRPIDQAMSGHRPAKETIRGMWIDAVRQHAQSHNDDYPLYLTLPGAEGIDIQRLADAGLINRAENGALAADSINRVAAIERSSLAVLELQKLIPGLNVIKSDVKAALRGNSILTFPNANEIKVFSATVVNLDFQDALKAEEKGNSLHYPVFTWIRKVSDIHAEKRPQEPWCLCLTLKADLISDQPATILERCRDNIQGFLRSNFTNNIDFAGLCASLLGERLYGIISGEYPIDFTSLDAAEQQKILMVFVPKYIANITSNSWKIAYCQNICYGGSNNHSPMVTWVIHFRWDRTVEVNPTGVYNDSLMKIMSWVRAVNDQGEIEELY